MKGEKNYDNARIYKLIDAEDYFYIGHTCTTLNQRLGKHKSTAKKNPEMKVYKYYNAVGWDTVRIILIVDDLDVCNMEQLLREEDSYIRMYKEDPKCLNSNNATETKEERLARKALWHKDNSEKLKDYYKYNSEKVKDWNKQYYKNNCEKVKDRMQKYREANSEKLKQCRKRRYEATREQILEKMREKIECPNCGYQIHRGGIYRHKKTDLCRSFSGAQTI